MRELIDENNRVSCAPTILKVVLVAHTTQIEVPPTCRFAGRALRATQIPSPAARIQPSARSASLVATQRPRARISARYVQRESTRISLAALHVATAQVDMCVLGIWNRCSLPLRAQTPRTEVEGIL